MNLRGPYLIKAISQIPPQHTTTQHNKMTSFYIPSHPISSPYRSDAMQVMKDKARVLHNSNMKNEVEEVEVEAGSSHGPMYRSIMKKLTMLKPEELILEDESYKHAGTSI